ncbi:uncharacterized protein LOC144753809 [Lissotriton helveticus]
MLNKLSIPGKQRNIHASSMADFDFSLHSFDASFRPVKRAKANSTTDRRGVYPMLIQERDFFAELIKYHHQNKGTNTRLNLFRLHASSATHHEGIQPEDEAEEDFLIPAVPRPLPKAKPEKKLVVTNPVRASKLKPVVDEHDSVTQTVITAAAEGSGNMGSKEISGQGGVQMTKSMGMVNLNLKYRATEVQKAIPTKRRNTKPFKTVSTSPPTSKTPSSEETTSSLWRTPPSDPSDPPTQRGIQHVKRKSNSLRKDRASVGLKKNSPSLPSGNLQSKSAAGEQNSSVFSISCNPGYVHTESLCKSVCELNPAYCHNRGKCLILENVGPLCRCSQKEYIWYKGDRCESYLTDLQLNGIIIGCCLLVSILLLLFPLLLMKTTPKKTEKKPLGSTSRLWISSLMPHMNLSFSTLSDSSDATERTMFDTRPRWSTFLDAEKNQISHDSNSWRKERTTF